MSEPFPLLTRYLGDWRTFFTGPAAGLLQLMHPAIGDAVARQSGFFRDPTARIFRSVPQIWAVILDADHRAERGKHIRDLHRNIQGVDGEGRAYHALNPEVYWWAHATFTWQVFRAIELYFPGGLDSVDTEALYAETVAWYRLYSVSPQPVPPDYAAFRAKFDAICAETLERTAAAERALRPPRRPRYRIPRTPKEAQRIFWREFTTGTLHGALPAAVCARFGIPWTAADRRRFALVRAMLQGYALVPRRAHRSTVELYLRVTGRRTRAERYRP